MKNSNIGKRILTSAWVKAAAIRALKTVAQTAAATIGTSAILSNVDWRVCLSAAVLAGILSLLTSVGGYGISQNRRNARRNSRRHTAKQRGPNQSPLFLCISLLRQCPFI